MSTGVGSGPPLTFASPPCLHSVSLQFVLYPLLPQWSAQLGGRVKVNLVSSEGSGTQDMKPSSLCPGVRLRMLIPAFSLRLHVLSQFQVLLPSLQEIGGPVHLWPSALSPTPINYHSSANPKPMQAKPYFPLNSFPNAPACLWTLSA